MSNVFPLDSKVRFTKERLSILTPRDRQGLAGRIGVVQTDGNRVQKPTVYFPSEGDKLDLRLFRVDPRHLELVESPFHSENTTRLDDGANSDHPVNAEPAAPDGGDRLSQSDMDNLFD
jgi:hypothetical protein